MHLRWLTWTSALKGILGVINYIGGTMREFQNGDQVVIGGRAFGDETKYCLVMGYQCVNGVDKYLVVKVSANYTEWVDAKDVFGPNECLLDGEVEFKQHGVELAQLQKESEECGKRRKRT